GGGGGVGGGESGEPGGNGFVRARRGPAGLELVERGDERFGHVPPAVGAEGAAHGSVPFRAAATHARTASWSLTPGSDSVERAESTAHGCTASIAPRTLAGPRPPASITRPAVARARSRCDGSASFHGRSTTVPTSAPLRRS